jgi:hypothetical protein
MFGIGMSRPEIPQDFMRTKSSANALKNHRGFSMPNCSSKNASVAI